MSVPQSAFSGERPVRPALRDLIFGLVIAAVALAYCWRADNLPVSGLSDAVGAGGLPKILGGFLFALGILLAARASYSIKITRRVTADASPQQEAFIEWRGVALLAISCSYILIAPVIGYMPAIFFLVIGTALTAGAPLNIRTALTAAGIALALAVLFVIVIGTEQPEGPFGPLLRSLGT
jgi:hypothetical protein